MQADPSAQGALLQIADLDKQIAQLTHRRRNLPENAELATLQAKRATFGEKVVAAETRRGDLDFEVQRIEKDLNPARARIERNRATIDAGSIAPKALAAMIDETEHLATRISDLEDAQLAVMEQVEAVEAEIAEARAARAEVETTMRGLLASREATAKDLDSQLAIAQERREMMAGRLPADLVELYDRIAARSTTGAAELRARRCGGCGLELDVTVLKALRASSPNEVVRCEECGRILVRTAESGL